MTTLAVVGSNITPAPNSTLTKTQVLVSAPIEEGLKLHFTQNEFSVGQID